MVEKIKKNPSIIYFKHRSTLAKVCTRLIDLITYTIIIK